MTITDEQAAYIAANLEFYGIAQQELKEDLLDHICTYIEEKEFTSFDNAYQEAILKFGGHNAMGNLQQQTYSMVMLKNNKQMQRTIYISGFTAGFCLSTGSLFKIMHWPFATILLLSGFIILNLICMPVFFYHKYKMAGKNIISS